MQSVRCGSLYRGMKRKSLAAKTLYISVRASKEKRIFRIGKRVLWDLPGRRFRIASSCRHAARWQETGCYRSPAGRWVPGESRAVSTAATAGGLPEKSSSYRVKYTSRPPSCRETKSAAITSCSSISFLNPWPATTSPFVKFVSDLLELDTGALVSESQCVAGKRCRSSASEGPRLAKRSVLILIVSHYWLLSIRHRSVYSGKAKIRRYKYKKKNSIYCDPDKRAVCICTGETSGQNALRFLVPEQQIYTPDFCKVSKLIISHFTTN